MEPTPIQGKRILIGFHTFAILVESFVIFKSVFIATTYKSTVRTQMICITATLIALYLFALLAIINLEKFNPFYYHYRDYFIDPIAPCIAELFFVVAVCSIIHYSYLVSKTQKIITKILPFSPFIHPTTTVQYWRTNYIISITATILILIVYCIAHILKQNVVRMVSRIVFSVFELYLTVVGISMALVSFKMIQVLNNFISTANITIMIIFVIIRFSDIAIDIVYYTAGEDQEAEYAKVHDIVFEVGAIIISVLLYCICERLWREQKNIETILMKEFDKYDYKK